MYRKLISISGYNYTRLKTLETVGDSFNDVLTRLLDVLRKQEAKKGLFGESGLEAQFTRTIHKPNLDRLGECDIG